MPVPKPRDGETQEEFIERCMGDEAMQEYEQDQRAAICYSTWNDSKGYRLLGVEAFRAGMRAGARPSGGVFRVSALKPKAVDEKSRRIRFCFSDGSVDRSGDRIEPDGWDTASFLKNPVALWAHDSYAPPIGRAGNVGVEGDRLMGDIEFAAAEVYPFADTVYRLVRGSFVNAVSVGFLPIEYSFVEEKDRPWGIDFKRQELLEISVVPVPCNANALAEARAKGIDTRPVVEWAERALDGGGKLIVSKRELERLRRLAKEPPRRARRRDGDGMGESDPSAGGVLVANCGRKAEEDCGLKNSEECMVHGQTTTGDKAIAALTKELRELNERLKRSGLDRRVSSRRRATAESTAEGAEHAEPDGDEPDGDEHEEQLRAAHAHIKAAGVLYDGAAEHHEKAMDRLEKAVDHFENPEAEEGKSEDGLPEEHVRAAHAYMKAAAELFDAGREHHEKAEAMLGEAVDHIDNAEAEEGKSAQARARATARALAAKHARETSAQAD